MLFAIRRPVDSLHVYKNAFQMYISFVYFIYTAAEIYNKSIKTSKSATNACIHVDLVSKLYVV